MTKMRSSCIRVGMAILVMLASAAARAQAQNPTRTISPADRNAAAQRLMQERLERTPPIARAVMELHRSLSTSHRLAVEALEGQRGEWTSDGADVLFALAIERRNLAVALEAIYSPEMDTPPAADSPVPRQRPRTERGKRPSEQGSTRRTSARPASRREAPFRWRAGIRPLGGLEEKRIHEAFGRVDGIVHLMEALEQAIETDDGYRVFHLVEQIEAQTARALQSIRVEPGRPTGIVTTTIPTVRRDPASED